MRLAIETGTPPIVGGVEGRHLIACIEAAARAASKRCEAVVEEPCP